MNRTHFCTQVQPASTINNVYDAQLCIYYTPEQATTGQITQAERATQSSQVDLIKLINLIDEITKIIEIVEISKIKNAFVEGFDNIVRNPRFDVELDYWTVGNAVVLNQGFYCDNSLRIGDGSGSGYGYQCLPPFYGGLCEGGLRYRSNTADALIAVVYISYTDGSNTSFTLNGTSNAWSFLNITGLNVSKKLAYVLLSVNAPYVVDFTQIHIYSNISNVIAAQSARTNLLVKPEREDLSIKYFSNTFAGAADYSVLAAVAAQSHKVFAVNYESSGDVEVCLREATEATKKAFVRTTKGVYGQTLVHPWVLTANTILNLRAEGVTTVKGYVQYKTEA